jgi:hypothetical protein
MPSRIGLRWIVGSLVVGGTGVLAATLVSRGGTREVTLPAGTRLVGTLEETVSTGNNRVGDRIRIRTDQPLVLSAEDQIPGGMTLEGEITHIKGGGRLTGAPELTIRFTRLAVQGRDYPVATDPFRVRGRSSTPETAAEIGGGAVAGGVIGAIAGSAVKGAVVGAVLGTGVAIATEGEQIVLREGRALRVELNQPITIRYRPESPSPPGQKR